MSRSAVHIVFIVLFCMSGMAQTPSPAQTPPPADDDVVKITNALIQVDVSVTDKTGKVVTDLKPEEIELFENGQKQKITGFRFVSNMRTAEVQEKSGIERGSIALPAAAARAERVNRTIALVVDDLTLSFESIVYVRQTLKKFVDEQMKDGDLVAIIRTGGNIGALQQFTNDKRQLHAAIERLRWNPLGGGEIGTFKQTEPKYDLRYARRPPAVGERTLLGLQREFEDTRQSVFATGTLGAVDFIVRGMQDLPGRKSIMLLSNGFRMYSEDAVGFREGARVLEGMRKLVDSANRASVVIYTVDARGLETNGMTALDSTSGWSREEINREYADRNNKLLDSQVGLAFLAEKTGGTAIVNTSDLAGGIRKVLDDQSFYLVAFEPDDATFDAKSRRFNTLEIKVTRPDTHVRYRSGFFGVSEETRAKPRQTAGERMSAALTSPFGANDIALKLNALFYNSPGGGTVRSFVHVRAQDLKFLDESGGRKKVIFDVVIVGFGENGVAVDQKSQTQTMVLNKEMFDRVMESGFVYDFLFPIKKPGSYQLRVALRDHGSNKLGTASQFVEVPDMRDERLLLSGVVLENISFADWQRQSKGQQTQTKSDPLKDTSLREFKRGTVLNYGFTIYNARSAGTRHNLSYQTRIFRDGKLIFEGKNQPVAAADVVPVNFTSTLSLGSEMPPGDYVLQVLITDNAVRGTNNTAAQFVQFEIVD